jgi:hypothetical protein
LTDAERLVAEVAHPDYPITTTVAAAWVADTLLRGVVADTIRALIGMVASIWQPHRDKELEGDRVQRTNLIERFVVEVAALVMGSIQQEAVRDILSPCSTMIQQQCRRTRTLLMTNCRSGKDRLLRYEFDRMRRA